MKEPVYFLGLELENVRCFGEKAKLDLSDGNGNWKKWTIILGDNGTGKTTLLQCLGLCEMEKSSGLTENRFGPKIKRAINFFNQASHKDKFDLLVGKRILIFLNYYLQQEFNSHILIEHKINNSIETPSYKDTVKIDLNIFGYGANRFMNLSAVTENESENSETLFNDDAKLINAEEWLLNMDYASSRESHLKIFAAGRKKLIIDVLLNLLPDIKAINFTTPTMEKLTPSVEFQTDFGNWVSIHQLSLGYKTMVAWMVDLAARMFKRYPESDNPLKEPAIVLVDEIDLHLHPKWQREIFNHLSKNFPATQFIVTAHSPLIVQSAPKDANIVVLRKEGDHVIIDNDIKSVHNWRLDQIMSSDLFGGISTRNEDVEDMLKRRNELLNIPSPSESEQKELEQLNAEADEIPFAENKVDMEAKEIIRKAAEYFKQQGVH